MNAKQAARAAAKRIEELEDFNKRCSSDIKWYNNTILAMIGGKSPCDFCEEHRLGECSLETRVANFNGCEEWWLMKHPIEEEGGTVEDESSGILSAGPTCGT